MAGFAGDIPATRINFLTHVMRLQGKEGLLLYGGNNIEGDSYDDIYHLNLHQKKWTCVYRGETINKLSAEGKKVTFCGSKLVEVGSGSPGVLDLIRILDICELFSAENDFAAVMVEHLQALCSEVEEQINEVVAVMASEPQENDFEGLRNAMGGIFTVSNKAEALEYNLDTLHEISSYLQAGGETSAVEVAAKASALHEQWLASKKAMPSLRKAIKPQIEQHGGRIKDEIAAFTDEATPPSMPT